MSRRALTARSLRTLVAGMAVTTLASGCQWEGLNSLQLPGAEGRGDGSYRITVEMPDVTTLTMNSPVRVNDVNVGSIEGITARDYTAIVTVSLDPSVQLPGNAHARIGQTSLLGSSHLELVPPPDGPPTGALHDGDTIPLAHAGVYPTTEQTLSALSVVLTDGGLQQFQQISDELNKAVSGRQVQAKDVIGQLKTTVQGLDKQRGDIVAAMSGIDRLTRQVNQQNDTLARALQQVPQAMKLLNDQKQQLTTALTSLGDFGYKANTLIQTAGADLSGNIKDLVPILENLASTGRNLTRVMNILVTFPFPQNAINNFQQGDFANLYVNADATYPRLQETFFLGTDMGKRMRGLEGVVGMAPTTSSKSDPYSLEVPKAPAPIAPEAKAAAPSSPAPSSPAPTTPAPAAPAEGGTR